MKQVFIARMVVDIEKDIDLIKQVYEKSIKTTMKRPNEKEKRWIGKNE